MTKQERVERYRATIEYPTLILVDAGFLKQEWMFYTEAFCDLDPELPRNVYARMIDLQTTVSALRKHGKARVKKSIPVIFQQKDDFKDLFIFYLTRFRTVHCSAPTCDEMRKEINSHPDINRVMIMGYHEGYLPLLRELVERHYDICLIKRKQENEDDWSRIPDDLPSQFSYYVIGEAIGLTREEMRTFSDLPSVS